MERLGRERSGGPARGRDYHHGKLTCLLQVHFHEPSRHDWLPLRDGPVRKRAADADGHSATSADEKLDGDDDNFLVTELRSASDTPVLVSVMPKPHLPHDRDRRAKWDDIVTHLSKYKVIMPTKSPNQGLPVYAKNEAGWDMPAHAIQLHGVYPCEVLNLRSDPESLKIARNTLYYYEVSQKGFTETMNELGLSAFVMGARMGFDAGILVENMKELIKTAGSNFLINDGNHCTEKAAIVPFPLLFHEQQSHLPIRVYQ